MDKNRQRERMSDRGKNVRSGMFAERTSEKMLPARLKVLRESVGYTQMEMNSSLGLGKRGWQRYEGGDQTPGSQVIAGLVRLGFNANWVLTGDGPMRMDDLVRPGEVSGDRVYITIPRYVMPGEKGAETDIPSEIASLAFSRKWLESRGLKPVDLVYVRMPDDSMQPTIRAGGLVVIDASTDKLRGDGVYVLKYQGEIAVKRLQVDFGGGLWVRGDNTAYREQRLSLEEAGRLYVIGRVIWAGGEI